MADVPWQFKLHVVAGFALIAIWPFTRLVHAFSAPVGYVHRPYVVYRCDVHTERLNADEAPSHGA